ncbi:MAG: zinc-finger domain-containing protein [Kangiellaceae bacterium]|nr:zinc-finger domain-containing protein [Kangiellaceae bacterium]MCW8997182.1 zinc-finger domain-containing protein [Kangiellaceae bacterium]
MTAASEQTNTAASKPVLKVSKEALPACCPPKEQEHWNQHPRVYLELSDGKASCPYCGNRFELAG